MHLRHTALPKVLAIYLASLLLHQIYLGQSCYLVDNYSFQVDGRYLGPPSTPTDHQKRDLLGAPDDAADGELHIETLQRSRLRCRWIVAAQEGPYLRQSGTLGPIRIYHRLCLGTDACTGRCDPHLQQPSPAQRSKTLQRTGASRLASNGHCSRGSKYPIFEVADPKNHEWYGLWHQKPQLFGTWGPLGCKYHQRMTRRPVLEVHGAVLEVKLKARFDAADLIKHTGNWASRLGCTTLN